MTHIFLHSELQALVLPRLESLEGNYKGCETNTPSRQLLV